ncbi:DDB1- and CUL4-associated factor 4, variant 2 [Basidiobolus ranarum]|uniref:DDB1- and CUL4-associated factor 4, variant 2 n=1 Tax=Basidiobolus ranarum TaxID=34480 RepID=A0ABR2WL97_9FUNG
MRQERSNYNKNKKDRKKTTSNVELSQTCNNNSQTKGRSGKGKSKSTKHNNTGDLGQTSATQSSHTSTETEPNKPNAPVMPELPGFYYDSERKRYFKILPNRSAPINHPYRQDNLVQKQKQKEVVERNKIECENASKKTARKAHLSYLRDREIHSTRAGVSLWRDAEKFFCRSLNRNTVLKVPSATDITDFQVSFPCYSKCIVALVLLTPIINKILPHRTQIIFGQMDGHVRLLNYQHNTDGSFNQEWLTYTRHPTQITSISIGGNETVVCTSFNHWSLGRIFKDRVSMVHSSHMENTTIWASVVHGSKHIAFGTSDGLLVIDPNRENIHTRRIPTHSDAFTIVAEPDQVIILSLRISIFTLRVTRVFSGQYLLRRVSQR